MYLDLISVIVPVYNAGNYLSYRAAKLLDQTYPNVEFIFVDDFSSDNTWQVLHDLQKNNPNKNIKIYRNEKNLGPAQTRNNAVKLAQGKYIYFSDADDIANIKLLEKAYEKVQREQSDIVIFAFNTVDNNTSISVPLKKEILNSSSIYELQLNAFRISSNTCSKFVLKDLITQNNIAFPDLRLGEDLCWTLQLLLYAKKISFINEPLYDYFVTTDSLSSVKNACSIIDYYNVCKELIMHFECRDHLKKELFTHISDTYLYFIKYSTDNQKTDLARALFALPEIQDLSNKINRYSIWEKYPFYKLILKKKSSLRAKLKSRNAEYKKIKLVLATKHFAD